jgi:hypothetical protein
MKRLIVTLLLVVALILSMLSTIVTGLSISTSTAHVTQHTYQIAARRAPCYHGVPEPWCPVGY